MGISIWHLLMVLLIVALVFGTKKLRNVGGDLGFAFKSFKKAMSDAEEGHDKASEKQPDRLGPPTGEEIYTAETIHQDAPSKN